MRKIPSLHFYTFSKTILCALFLLMLGCAHEVQSQTTAQGLYIDKKQYSCDSLLQVSVRSSNLRRLIAMQGTISWDTSVVWFRSVASGTASISLNESNMNLNNVTQGQLTFLWYDNNLLGQSVPSDTALFTINFSRNGIGKGVGAVDFSNSPTIMEIDTLDILDVPRKNNDAVFTNGYLTTPTKYVFEGAGNWSDAVNWKGSLIPPAVLPVCSEILINPTGTAECLLSASQRISAGAIFSIATGKKFRTTGGLIIAR